MAEARNRAVEAGFWGTRMNTVKDQAGDGASRQKRLPAPDSVTRLMAPAGDLRDNAQVAALLQSIANEISQSDQRQGNSLADLRSRLNLMTERQPPAAETPPETASPAAEARPPLGHKRPALALEDKRNPAPEQTPVFAARQPAPLAVEAMEPVRSAAVLTPPKPVEAAPKAPPMTSFDHIYASVAETYVESKRGGAAPTAKPIANRIAPPARALAPDLDDDFGDFLDMSALVEPQTRRPVASRVAAPPLAVEPAPARGAVEASLAMQLSISALAERISDTEHKIELAVRRPDDTRAIAALSLQIEGLRGELEKLVTEHETVSASVGQVSANVTALSQAAGRIGPMSDSIAHLNEAILALRKELPAIAESTAERTSSKVAATLAKTDGHAELADKLAVVQTLLLTQAREHQANDGRSYGALESIRGLVQNLHSRIDAMEAVEEPLAAVAMPPAPVPAASRFASALPLAPKPAPAPSLNVHIEPEFADDSLLADEPEIPQQPQIAAHAMSREDLIASARRAAMATAPRTPLPASDRMSELRSLAMPKPTAGLFGALGSRSIVTLAMVALLAAGLGLIYGKVMHKRAPAAMPAVTIEQTALPDVPDDIPEAGAAKMATAPAKGKVKDASKPQPAPPVQLAPAAPAEAVPLAPAPEKNSSLLLDDQGLQTATASSLPAGAESHNTGIAGGVQPANLTTMPAAQELPANIAPLSVRSAALLGDATAAYAIGDRFLAGKGVARDPARARHWYEQAAKAGLPIAEFKLGALFERGEEGVAADRASALVWYQKGASHGNVQSMHNLAVLFTAQSGGEPDYAQAAQWFEQAASFGLKDSQYNLAVLYENGLGVPKDAGIAYKWLAIAAAHGDAEAAKRRDVVRKSVPPETLASVEAQAKAWRPKMQDHKANSADILALANAPMVPVSDVSAPAASAAGVVGQVQAMLGKLGFDPGTLDGTLTAQTRQAIRSFQERSGLQPTGEISSDLIGKLKALAG